MLGHVVHRAKLQDATGAPRTSIDALVGRFLEFAHVDGTFLPLHLPGDSIECQRIVGGYLLGRRAFETELHEKLVNTIEASGLRRARAVVLLPDDLLHMREACEFPCMAHEELERAETPERCRRRHERDDCLHPAFDVAVPFELGDAVRRIGNDEIDGSGLHACKSGAAVSVDDREVGRRGRHDDTSRC